MDADDLARFERAVLPHLDAAYTFARYLTRDPHDAEDVVQESYLRALRGFAGYRGEVDDARGWLLAIVRNTCRTFHARERRFRESEQFDDERHTPGDGAEPDALLLRQDARETLGDALARLPTEFREVLVLREVQGLAYKEIAEAAGIPIGTVMSRLARARARLERLLGADPERRR